MALRVVGSSPITHPIFASFIAFYFLNDFFFFDFIFLKIFTLLEDFCSFCKVFAFVAQLDRAPDFGSGG